MNIVSIADKYINRISNYEKTKTYLQGFEKTKSVNA